MGLVHLRDRTFLKKSLPHLTFGGLYSILYGVDIRCAATTSCANLYCPMADVFAEFIAVLW